MRVKTTITRDDFLKYEETLRGGKYKMLYEEGRNATGLTEDKYVAIRTHYREFLKTTKEEPGKEILLVLF